ncbi:uncharacterized protein LOC128995849 [Macrosteles quadrilineatus]|uniref:uncharacterized protein LOC128995849 n=1 Tax=Macrosteles quadrilineatus TaxID=74068 RepID=UPI0023E1B2BF|nr:uncharacterized protein LOC128995849 [Macrosteles quadrilineatus]
MAHQSERNIPHLRDIFGFHDKKKNSQEKHHDTDSRESWDDCNLKNADSSSISTNGGNDSAISLGSTSDEEQNTTSSSKKKKQQRRREKTEQDVKHLERHLSMKKTIRKKIMRDLQQAFVEDPNEFRVEDIPPEQLKAELNLQSLSFGTSAKKKGKKTSGESNFLDFLRTGSGDSKNVQTPSNTRLDDTDSGHGSPTRELSVERGQNYDEEEDGRKVSFWRRFTMKTRSKR